MPYKTVLGEDAGNEQKWHICVDMVLGKWKARGSPLDGFKMQGKCKIFYGFAYLYVYSSIPVKYKAPEWRLSVETSCEARGEGCMKEAP